jgi:undecaprenyl pyrophosphate phosphatase UppP
MLNLIKIWLPTAWAQGVDLLAPLSNGKASGQNTDINSYLAVAFPIFIQIIALLAIVIIAWGGIQYMFSRVPGVKSDAKGRIWAALGGLILALGAWVFLNTLNPKIKDANLQDVLNSSRQP